MIGGRTFTVHQLGFGASRNLLVLLGQVLGPGLAGVKVDGGGLESAGVGAIAGGIGGMLAQLTPEQLDKIQGALALRTFVDMGDGKKPLLSDAGFDVVFDGRMADYFEWLQFALGVNYAGFFGALRTAFARWVGARNAGKAAGAETQTGSG